MFQSRSGFSVRRDWTQSSRASKLSNRFNPGLGFLSVATPSAPLAGSKSKRFNPGLGFLSVATAPPSLTWTSRGDVSIPVWVFCPSRRTKRLARRSVAWFQSRSGFSVRRDRRSVMLLTTLERFNPGLGFLSVATELREVNVGVTTLFQSRSGFSVRRDRRGVLVESPVGEFQSRSGFSVRRDRRPRLGPRVRSCFNPGLGFLSVATIVEPPAELVVDRFQSRSGFSVRRDACCSWGSGRTTTRFNPGLGFLSVATCSWILPR